MFWPLIVSFIQDPLNNKIALFGLKCLNQLIQNEGTHEQILIAGKATFLEKRANISKMQEEIFDDQEDVPKDDIEMK